MAIRFLLYAQPHIERERSKSTALWPPPQLWRFRTSFSIRFGFSSALNALAKRLVKVLDDYVVENADRRMRDSRETTGT